METPVIIRCKNCGNEFSGKYCSHCSQKHYDREHLSVAHFLGDAFHQFTHFDGKIFRSIRLLLTKPGFISDEYIQGRHKSYISPIAFFIVLNLFFYLLGYKLIGLFHWSFPELLRNVPGADAMLEKKLSQGIQYSELENRFNIARAPYIKMVFMFIIPCFALGLNLLFISKKRTFIEHLIFSVHFYAFNLLFISLGMLLIGLLVNGIASVFGIQNPLILQDPWLTVWITLIMAAYLFLSARRFYKIKTGETLLYLIPMLVLYIACTFILGKFVVFHLTMWSI